MCWYVGAFISSEDKTDEFIDEGIWINGYNDKYLDNVNSVKVGDKIAIKSAYTQKYNLPFDINGGTASVMEIKAVGTVTKNHKDGRTLDVEWITLSPSKKWYFYTMRNTIWKVERSDDDSYNNVILDFIPIPETTVDKPNGINNVCRRCPPHHTAVCFRRPP